MNLEDLCAPFDPDDYADDREALARYYVDLDEAYQLVRKHRAEVGAELAHRLADLEDPVEVGGYWVQRKLAKKVDETAGQVRDKVYPQIRRYLIDPETNERIEAIPIDEAKRLMTFKMTASNLTPYGVRWIWHESVSSGKLGEFR